MSHRFLESPSSEGGLSLAINDPTLREIVGRKFYSDLIARNDADEVFSHSAGHMCHDFAACLQLHAESSICQCLCDGSFDLEGFFFISQNQTSNQESLSIGETKSPSHRREATALDDLECVASLGRGAVGDG